MSDKRIIEDQKVKEVGDVLIASTSKEFWDCNKAKTIAFQGNSSKDVQYVAFYRTSPISAITHIGKVKYTEKNVPAKETVSGFPDLAKIAKRRKWYDSRHKVYHLESIEELPNPIKKGKSGPVRVKWVKPLIKLMTARTISDLK